jgi:hypothetical protein
MTDDSNFTPGGEMNDNDLIIEMKSVPEGHLVEWTKNGVLGQLGPFKDIELAERAMEAKRVELTVNPDPI